MAKKKFVYNPRFNEYAGGITSFELIEALKQQHAQGKKVLIVVGSSVNQLELVRYASAPESSGSYIFGFSTKKAERKITL